MIALWVIACRAPDGSPSPPPGSTTSPATTDSALVDSATTTPIPEPLACDLPDIPQVEPSRRDLDPFVVARVIGAPGDLVGMAVQVVPGDPAGTLVTATLQIVYDDSSPVWLVPGPLPPGTTDIWDAAPTVLRGGIALGMNSAAGDLTGDGVADLVLAAIVDVTDVDLYVVELPAPVGQFQSVDRVATAIVPGDWSGVSVGDWDGDGALDLGATGAGAWETQDMRVRIFQPPFPAELGPGTPASATFDTTALDSATWNSGSHGILIGDVDGDGAADVLGSGDAWPDFAPYPGDSLARAGAYVLFSGNDPGDHAVGPMDTGGQVTGDQVAILYGTCDPGLSWPVNVGDVTGDGQADVAVLERQTMIGGRSRGAVLVMSELGTAHGTVSSASVSGAVIAGHFPTGLYGNFAAMVGADLDQDGTSDLIISDYGYVAIFRGPVQGFLDIGQADLTIQLSNPLDYGFGYAIAAGDLTGDGVPDLAVGENGAGWGGPSAGAVAVLDGARIVAAFPPR